MVVLALRRRESTAINGGEGGEENTQQVCEYNQGLVFVRQNTWFNYFSKKIRGCTLLT
ncbi:hypothetical protein Hanom_Chr09g00798061 [Helianthus anomalus]